MKLAFEERHQKARQGHGTRLEPGALPRAALIISKLNQKLRAEATANAQLAVEAETERLQNILLASISHEGLGCNRRDSRWRIDEALGSTRRLSSRDRLAFRFATAARRCQPARTSPDEFARKRHPPHAAGNIDIGRRQFQRRCCPDVGKRSRPRHRQR